MRIDSHQHFWNYNPDEHVWMTDQMDVLKTDYLPDNLSPLLERTSIDGTVSVQARQNLHETEWLLELSDQYDLIKGVVGWVDMRSPEVSKQLEQYASHPKFVGVRHVVHDEPDDQFILGEAFLDGMSQLRAFNLTYDLLLFPKHLPYAIRVVERFPEQRFVLDHIAKPLIKEGTLEPWASDIRQLAQHENVYCKVSGMVTEAVWKGWKKTDFAPYLDIIFDCFGAERLMFGSDWPVCTLSATYAEVVGIVSDYILKLSEDEQARIMGINSIQFYDLQ
jgi:L-fuconolactonase